MTVFYVLVIPLGGTMQITSRVMMGWLGAILAIGLFAGCNVDATSNTGLRVNVYVDADSTSSRSEGGYRGSAVHQ